ncbi:MAG: BLUF domain-containing protein [Hymenobacteraceae bacterium]|nr:BLUF domain-containing protein [Hymenobacteraceae bacterium]MDX5396851.1 BLUF domain-containing protein [Hymenobacteraceae bacterium]MDX5512923.1 BLUF domain-containing protein [Hymenobacteraceae bacterium]
MYHIVYVSTAIAPMADEELELVLDQSRKNNSAQNITGMLLYSDEHFIQLLEGEADAVKAAFSRIEKDVRHYNIVKLADGPITQKSFSDWEMGFQIAPSSEIALKIGYTNPTTQAFFDALPEFEEESVVTVLKAFAENNMPRF